MKKMKIVMFSECYDPTINGVVISIKTFKKDLEKLGHTVLVVAPKPKKPYIDQDKNIFRVPSIAIPGHSYYPIGVPFFSKIPQIIRKEKPDIIHVHGPFFMFSLALKTARICRIPLVYTYHTLLAEYAHYGKILTPLVKKFLIWHSKRICNKADLVITPTNFIKELLLSYGVKTEIVPLATGIELGQFGKANSKKIRQELNIPLDAKVIIYVGRLAEEKNISFLIKAVQKIFKKLPNSWLLLVGGGPQEEEYLAKIKALGMDKRTVFTGYLPKERVNEIWSSADLFLMPSETDTQGLVVVEALASGVPVVAIKKYGPAEIIIDGECGFLVKSKDLDGFVQKAIQVLTDETLHQKLREGALKRAQDFDSKRQAEKLIAIYQRLIK